MTAFMQRLFAGTLGLSLITLPVLLCAPLLTKRYQQRTLYGVMLILTLSFVLMPFIPARRTSLLVLPAPSINASVQHTKAAAVPASTANHSDTGDLPLSDAAVTDPVTTTQTHGAVSGKTAESASRTLTPLQPTQAPSRPDIRKITALLYLTGAACLFTGFILRHIRFSHLIKR